MKILPFPDLRQTYMYDCGAVATQGVLAYYGFDVSGSYLMDKVGTTKKGTEPKGIIKTLKEYNLECESGTNWDLKKVKYYLKKGIPIIMLLQAWTSLEKNEVDWENNWGDGHYVIAIGYDKKRIYFEDPYSIMKTFLTFDELESRWHDIVGSRHYYNYAIAVIGKKRKYSHKKIIPMG